MASNLVDLTKLGNALSRFKTKILNVAKPNALDVVIGQNVPVAMSGGTAITITNETAGMDLSTVTVLGVILQDAWPQDSWTSGACVSIVNFGINQNGSVSVVLTTNSQQNYRLGIRLIYVKN